MKKAGFEPAMEKPTDLQSAALNPSAISSLGIEGFEPPNVRTKNECLAIWLYSREI
jgi:hypothetical protein